MEETKEVKTVRIDYKCPKCEKGYLRPTEITLSTYPAQFPHKCTDCEYGEIFKKRYPYVDYVEI